MQTAQEGLDTENTLVFEQFLLIVLQNLILQVQANLEKLSIKLYSDE